MLTRLLLPALLILLPSVYCGCFKCDLKTAGITAVFPEDASYSSFINPFNPRYIYKPAAFTFPSTAEEVARVVQLAITDDLHVVARSGGHSYISNSLGGRDGVVVIDLRNMTSIHVNPITHIAKVETGNRLGRVALELNDAGRATPHGTCPDVGIGGHTSFGGSGYVNRQWGLALDAVEAVDVVLGNGTLVHASHDQHPDLFWAMRGAGASFGIATTFYMNTYPAPPSVTTFYYSYSNLTMTEATKALSTYQSFILSGPPSTLGINLVLGSNHSAGNLFVFFSGGFYDNAENFNSTIQPMLDGFPEVQQDGKPPRVFVDVGSYIHSLEVMGQSTGSQSLSNTTTPPYFGFTKSLMTPEKAPMSEKAIQDFVKFFAEDSAGRAWSLYSNCVLEAYGGPNSYLNNVPIDATSFAHRDTLFTFECSIYDPSTTLAGTPEVGYEYLDNLISKIVKNMPKDWNYGAYPNYIDDNLKDWQKRYYGAHYPRLQQIKEKYDPGNIFRFPLGIELPYY